MCVCVCVCFVCVYVCTCVSTLQDCRNVILIFSVRESGRFQGNTHPISSHYVEKYCTWTCVVIFVFCTGFARLQSESRHDGPHVPWVLPPGISQAQLGGVFKLEWIHKLVAMSTPRVCVCVCVCVFVHVLCVCLCLCLCMCCACVVLCVCVCVFVFLCVCCGNLTSLSLCVFTEVVLISTCVKISRIHGMTASQSRSAEMAK